MVAIGKMVEQILPHLQDARRIGLAMAKTFSENDDSEAIKKDEEIEQAVAELEGLTERTPTEAGANPVRAPRPEDDTPFDQLTAEEITEQLQRSGKMVIDTCMDIRRGENVLIVCDPTTGDIGQALHEAANRRSDRVLLIVMPKARHHGEEPPAPVANLMRQQQVVIAPTRYSLTHTGPFVRL